MISETAMLVQSGILAWKCPGKIFFCLVRDLFRKGLHVEIEKPLPIVYEGLRLDCGYRMDMVVEQQVVIEVKSVLKLEPVFTAQLLTYLKLSGYRVGLLIDFNVKILTAGLRRIVNDYPESLGGLGDLGGKK
jgi:GxxExxY protein